MNKKYYVYRETITGRTEVKMTKCGGSGIDWCSPEYLRRYPDRVWKFSKSGAEGIVARGNSRLFPNCAITRYYMVEA